MNEYSSLARFYDRLMCDNDYCAWADYYSALFAGAGAAPRSVIDLACGTGRLSCILAQRGFEVIGVDMSAEMLVEAQRRAEETDCPVKPLFVNQDLRELDLYGTADVAICSMDGINYIPPEDLGEVFRRISCFVEPGGLFIFDVNTEAKFRRMDGMTYIDEDDGLFCAWRTDYYAEERECVYGVDIFARRGELWQRSSEEHTEYTPDTERIKLLLEENGFEDIRFHGELSLEPPGADEDRIFIFSRRHDYTSK